MVNKDFFVKGSLPDEVYRELSDEQVDDVFQEIYEEHDFLEPGLMVLTGLEGKDGELRDAFKEYLDSLSEIPPVLTTKNHREKLLEDPEVSQDEYIYYPMNASDSWTEVLEARKLVSEGESVVFLTPDDRMSEYDRKVSQVFNEDWEDAKSSLESVISSFFTYPSNDPKKATNDYLIFTLGAEDGGESYKFSGSR